mmetsp:Transcript_59734/g.69829  ORF Transcript_59734/g.69829 Transcript_59734/m.69829 type:complete len:220 (-) Transcript_59734:155-814(-)
MSDSVKLCLTPSHSKRRRNVNFSFTPPAIRQISRTPRQGIDDISFAPLFPEPFETDISRNECLSLSGKCMRCVILSMSIDVLRNASFGDGECSCVDSTLSSSHLSKDALSVESSSSLTIYNVDECESRSAFLSSPCHSFASAGSHCATKEETKKESCCQRKRQRFQSEKGTNLLFPAFECELPVSPDAVQKVDVRPRRNSSEPITLQLPSIILDCNHDR